MKNSLFPAICAILISVSCIKTPPSGNSEVIPSLPPGPVGPVTPINPVDPKKPADLSLGGRANCYVASAPGYYMFDATVMGNGAYTASFPVDELHPSSAALIWQSSPDMVKNCWFIEESGYVSFNLTCPGNALIAALDADKNIIWSWHIWAPEEKVEPQCGFMNMNLGAMDNKEASVSSCGLLYQWGRKDPFPGSPILGGGTTSTKQAPVYDDAGAEVAISNSSWYDDSNNTVAYAIAHPTVCMSSMKHYSKSKDWLKAGENNPGLWAAEKTCFDPCPAGWQLPSGEEFAGFTNTGAFVYDEKDINAVKPYVAGWDFILPDGSISYFPAATRYDGSYGMFMGSMAGLWGNYWYCIADEDSELITHGALALSFSIKDMYGKDSLTASPVSTGGRADAYSVRCVLSRQ